MARMGALYELTGTRELVQALERASKDVQVRAARACSETARLIAAGGRAGAPRDRGDLQANITFEGKGLNWRVGIADVTLPSRGGNNSAHLNPWVYGVWYEYGFVSRSIPTTPFMRPAADREDAAHLSRLSNAVDAGLKVAA